MRAGRGLRHRSFPPSPPAREAVQRHPRTGSGQCFPDRSAARFPLPDLRQAGISQRDVAFVTILGSKAPSGCNCLNYKLNLGLAKPPYIMVNYIKSIYFRKSVVEPPSVFLNHFRNLCFSITF